MAEPISIGGQTFVKTSDGWIDKKSKIPADKGLLKLLNSLESDGPSPKLRVKIDRNREPVNFAGTKYVYDLNQKGWIDQKTKIKVHDKLQNILNGVSKPMASPASLGLIGQAGVSKTKDRKPDGSGVIPIQKKINEPIVSMISSLSTIDSYLKQRLDNQKKIAKGQLAALRETAIESTDATPVTQLKDGKEKSSSNAAALLMGAGVAAIIASQFEPVQEAFKVVADGVKSVFGYITRFAGVMADGLGSLLGGDAAPSNSSPATPNATPVSAPSPTPNGASQPQEQQVNQAEESESVQPPEASKPNQTETGQAQQTPSAPSNVSTPSAPSNVSTPSSPSRTASTLTGAATGAAIGMIAGPVGAAAGAAIGGAVGFFSGGSQSSPTPSTPSQTSNDATPQEVDAGGGGRLKDYIGTLFTLGGGRTGNAKNLENLDPEFEQQIIGVLREYTQTNPPPVLTSGFRYPGDQAAISGYMKAAPGKSRHERGLAMDFNSRDVNKMASLGILRRHGLHQRYGQRDPVHIEQIGPGGEGTSYQGGEDGGNLLNRVTGTITDLGAGVVKAIGNIMAAGFGGGTTRSLMDSLNQSPEATASAITRAAVEKNATIAEERSPDSPTASLPNPVNINQNPQSAAIENIAMPGDRASVDYYLTRFGFPKIEYNQRSPELRVA
jgi:hypothetical protein